jgi:3-deoxy-manno-octulosonate cytidylyltransferase (CMP-KDO synthetase)
MIEWVYRRARQAEQVTGIAVATDDPRIAKAVEGFGGRAILTSSDARSGTDRVAEAAEIMGMDPEDIVVNVQGDQPLIDPRCLDDVIRPLVSEEGIEMSTLAFKIIDEKEFTNPKDVKVTFDRMGFALYFSRAPIPFPRDAEPRFDTYKHLGVYAYSRRFLEIFRNLSPGTLEGIEKLEQLRAMEHGHRIRVVVTPYDSPEVDLPEDIPRIEALLRERE